MNRMLAVFRRELAGYFATPVAYVFIVIFLFVTGVFTFQLGQLYERGQADLRPFFDFHPWLYLFLIPAISMRLWAEERKQGTLELLMTLPIPMAAAVTGKFLAAWVFAGVALALTFPVWITVNVLGSPDNGVIVAAYIGSFLMAGGFLAIGSFVSSLTKNQVIAFVVTVVACFGFLISGYPPVMGFFSGWAPRPVLDAVAGFSFLSHFDAISRGVIDLRDVVFFASLIAAFLFANAVVVEWKKS
ncbi:MAG: ABC transporter permease subunit [Phycisphaeraceae bacterium]|nr:ABC transporter permease subunit [Phycisphaerae bacterium]MBX3391773.1 ABC transporter permease subunit [Phycisphaeraceae bacterium]HRJ49534.1 ABC transporter permease subunit [Phycisphaerales bacterium]